MNAPLHPSFRDAAPLPFAGRAGFGHALGSTTSIKWAALQEAGNAVAILAGLPPEKAQAEVRNLPALVRNAPERVRDRIDRGIDDLAAIMEPGLAALLAVQARGADATAPARVLWKEFSTLRATLVALVPQSGSMGPPRSA